MALIVEDGTGLPTAQSLCSVVDADAYHRARGNDAWVDLDTDVKEQALIKATDYIEQNYTNEFDGGKYTLTQALTWPRWEVAVNDYAFSWPTWNQYLAYNTVPMRVRYAVAELAYKAQSVSLTPDVAGGALKSRVKVGPIETEYDNESLTRAPKFPVVDGWLRPFLRSKGGKYYAAVVRA